MFLLKYKILDFDSVIKHRDDDFIEIEGLLEITFNDKKYGDYPIDETNGSYADSLIIIWIESLLKSIVMLNEHTTIYIKG